MMKKIIKVMMFVVLLAGVLAFTACNRNNEEDNAQQTQPPAQTQPGDTTPIDVEPDLTPEGIDPQTFRGIPEDTVGSVNVMLIAGNDAWWPNIGQMNLGPDDFAGAMNVAAIHAVARVFNRIFPNI